MKSRTYNLNAAEIMDSHLNNNSSDSRSNPSYFLTSAATATSQPQNGSSHIDSQKSHEIEEGNDDDYALTSCGIGSWRPKWLQVFATPAFFLLNMSLVGVIQGMSGPLFFSSMSTLEKRFAFDSRISGIILIADNFSQLIISPFVGYLG